MLFNTLKNGNGEIIMPKVVIDNDMTTDASNMTDEYLITKQFKTSAEFSVFVEKQAVDTNASLIDVIVGFCSKNNIEVESVKKLLTTSLKDKIRVEAEELNLLKGDKSGKLPR